MIFPGAITAKTVRRLVAVSILFLIILAAVFKTFAQTPSIDSEEQTMLKLINDYRAANGASQLKLSIALTTSADWMGTDMSTKNYFGHVDSTGRNFDVRIRSFNYNYPGYVGENLAAGYSDAARTFNQWKNSPTHNTVMLSNNFNVIGISRVYGQFSPYKWYWTTDFGTFVDATFGGGTATQTVRSVNAASYTQTIAPEGLAAAFGTQLAAGPVSAASTPLPTMIAGVNVTVNGVAAPLLFISPTQINYVVPTNVDPGTAVLRILNNGNLIGTGTVNVESVSPSIFTVTADGKGVPSAQSTFDGVAFQSVANPDGSARALSVGTSTKPNFLVLYGTGLRRRTSMANVRVTIGGLPASVTFLGAHPRFAGLDQLNVMMPQELRGRGPVDVVVTVDGKTANTVRINIGS